MHFKGHQINASKKQKKRKTARLFFSVLLSAVLILLSAAVCPGDEDVPAEDAAAETEKTVSVDPVSQDEGYSAVLYDNTSGLPTSEVNDIAETREGFIWIGSYSGLIRYDGNTFERMDSTAGIKSVKCLHVDSQDRLWIGTNGGGLALMEGDSLRKWDESDGLPSGYIQAIVEDNRGVTYVSTTGGLIMVDTDLNLCSLDDPRVEKTFMHDLELATNGLIYGLTNDGDLFVIQDGKVVRYLDSDTIHGNGANCIFPDPDYPNRVYIETTDSVVHYGRMEANVDNMTKIDISPLSQVQRFEYIGGKIWICARNGIGVLDDDGFHVLKNLPMNNSIGHIMTDYAGNLWFTSSRQGVMKIVPNQFSDLYARYNLPEVVVNSTCMLDDLLFVGTDSGLTVLDENGAVSEMPLTGAKTAAGADMGFSDLLEMLKDCRIRSVIRDSRNRLWISTWREHGLLCYDQGKVTAYTPEDGLLSDHVRAVCEREDGSFLVALKGGVNVIKNGHIIGEYGEKDGIGNTETLTVEEGFGGDILVGSDGGGIYVIGSDGTRHIGREEGLSSGAVMRIKRDPDREVFWIVTGDSLAYMTADYQVHVIEQFPYSNNFDLYENSEGDMWILSSNGIYIVPAEQLLENGGIDATFYGIPDGLPCIATANSYSELTENGDLYIAGSTGVAKVNIDKPFERIGDLKAAIPYVDADGVRLLPDESGNFTIASDVRKLTIYGYVFNYSLVNPQVSYRLEGFEEEYKTVRRSDLNPIDYTNLNGGTYRFVMEMNDPIRRETKTVSVEIVKEKAFYEHIWFNILSGLAVIAAIGAFVSLYFRRKMRIMEKKNREEAEKERVNTELDMARKIQKSVLPGVFPAFPDRQEFDIYAKMEPAKAVGGDFYDFFLTDDSHLCMVMADVSGKSIPAALFMMISKSILKNSAMVGIAPAEILEKTNNTIASNNQMEMFVTVWIGILDLTTGKLSAANAGHEYPALRRAGRSFTLQRDRHGLVIGAMEGTKYTEYDLYLHPGDKLFLYTDGVTEATDAEKNLFGTKRMIEALNSDPEASPQQVLQNVQSAVDAFVKDAEQFDDLTMMCLEFKGNKA